MLQARESLLTWNATLQDFYAVGYDKDDDNFDIVTASSLKVKRRM